jgi:hypothetical protein
VSDTPQDDQPKRPFRALCSGSRATHRKGGRRAYATGRNAPAPAVARGDRRLPARLGHYRIERKLGEGGMASSYAAAATKSSMRTVA